MSRTFHVVIVGGGTAGWMTAAYLRRAFDEQVSITVVESEQVGRIGVGEATFSTIRLFFEFLGLEEAEWMRACDATYKMAIKFVDWNRARRPFYHPFQRHEYVLGHSLADWWVKLRDGDTFDDACFVVPALCDAQRAPRYLTGRSFDELYETQTDSGRERATTLHTLQLQYPYAYHFDAQLVADFLRDYACARGVTHLRDDVLDVPLAPDGQVAGLATRGHGELKGDLYVDCTGFRGLLISQALKEPFISFSRSLLCDRAVAMQVPHAAGEGLNPFTTATALSSGWVWDIPLYSRHGTGYVYSSAFRSPEEAEAELRAHLGPASHDRPANHIRMRIGRHRNSWVGNVVAIGLSSGFVEPLESTGIFFIQHGIEELVSHFPAWGHDELTVRSYNRAVAECIDGVMEFLTLHYVASSRDDSPFWRATSDLARSEAFDERLRLWRMHMPTNKSLGRGYHGFEAYSYAVMLLGLAGWPERAAPVLDVLDSEAARRRLAQVRERRDRLVATLPSQLEYLETVVHRNPSRASRGYDAPATVAVPGRVAAFGGAAQRDHL